MNIHLYVISDYGILTYPVYSPFSMDERLDEELDGASIVTYTKTGNKIADCTDVIVSISSDRNMKEIPFIAFDSVVKISKERYRHTIELIEPTRLLMGISVDGLAVTQPIQETEKKKTLLEVLQRVLNCYNTRQINDVSYFVIDEATKNLLSNITSPEFRWEEQTLLFEVLQDIADVVNCIPRLTFSIDDYGGYVFNMIKFDEINAETGFYTI